MSVPVGQSDAQPLHARHRSSASVTAGSRRPSTSEPSSASWRIRARPRVLSFSSRVAAYDGHITPGGEGATHAPTPVHRWTAAPKESSWVSRNAVRTGLTGRAGRRSTSTGAGSTSTPGFSRPVGSQIALTSANSASDCASYISGNSSERARPSPCSPDSEPPYARRAVAPATRNSRNRLRPAASNSKSMRAWTHPSPKWP